MTTTTRPLTFLSDNGGAYDRAQALRLTEWAAAAEADIAALEPRLDYVRGHDPKIYHAWADACWLRRHAREGLSRLALHKRFAHAPV
jgi:hypothetical protein